jgi:hypothetical protein
MKRKEVLKMIKKLVKPEIVDTTDEKDGKVVPFQENSGNCECYNSSNRTYTEEEFDDITF